MREYRGAKGERCLWYEDDEIERTMEAEIIRSGLLPSAGQAEVDIERFIVRHLKARLDQHAELDDGVLGETAFVTDAPCEVRINRALTNAVDDEDGGLPGVRGRWRATMAHEAAHILLHRILFTASLSQGSLFDTPVRPASRQIQGCLHRDVGFATSGGGSDWREVQANKGMAALLMPRSLFCEAARAEFLNLPGAPRAIDAGSPNHSALAALLAGRFAVSKQAASIRLQTLRVVSKSGQGSFL